MKLRIAAFALAFAFAVAPALSAFAAAGCVPCPDMAQSDAPCTALSAASCCGDVAPSAVKTAPELPGPHGLVSLTAIHAVAFSVRAPHTAPELAAATRLSVVRRL